ncbi:hypothetical protein D3C80_1058050 [compost metagenome]
MAGQFLVQRHEAGAINEGPERAIVDQHLAFGEAVGDDCHILEVAGVEVTVLELANSFQRFQASNALFKVHFGPCVLTLTSLQ